MSIDIASDVAGILGSNADLPRTAGVYAAAGGATSETVTGVLVERSGERLGPTRAPERQESLLLLDATEFATVTVRAAGDTFTPTGEGAWTVVRVRERQAHVTLNLERTRSTGTAA